MQTATNAADTLRSMYRTIKAERRTVADGEQERIGDLVAALGATVCAAKAKRAFRDLGWNGKRSGLMLGDIVATVYHGVHIEGRLHSFDGSGCLYIDFPNGERPVVLGIARDGICVDRRYTDEIVYVVSRPETQPEVKVASSAALGGEYIPRTA